MTPTTRRKQPWVREPMTIPLGLWATVLLLLLYNLTPDDWDLVQVVLTLLILGIVGYRVWVWLRDKWEAR